LNITKEQPAFLIERWTITINRPERCNASIHRHETHSLLRVSNVALRVQNAGLHLRRAMLIAAWFVSRHGVVSNVRSRNVYSASIIAPASLRISVFSNPMPNKCVDFCCAQLDHETAKAIASALTVTAHAFLELGAD
jgi:hypothetical protein